MEKINNTCTQFKPDQKIMMIKGFAQKSPFVVKEYKDLLIDLKDQKI